MAEFRRRLLRLIGVTAALTLLMAPTSALAQADQSTTPITVPALTN